MERKINTLEHCQTEVIVTFDKAEFDSAKKKAFDKLKKNVSIKGFRKGNAPDNLVREKINQVELMDEAINSLLPEAYREIIETDKVEPYARPQIEVTEFAEDHLTVKFLITTAPVCAPSSARRTHTFAISSERDAPSSQDSHRFARSAEAALRTSISIFSIS